MRLLVVRHGAAEDKDAFARTGQSDDLRPLTAQGKRELRDVARGIRTAVSELDVLATSPLVRAVQTAEILGDVYDRRPVTVESLQPDAPYESFARWARSQRDKETVAIVGHEPHLSGLVSWLIASSSHSVIELKKAAACLVAIEGTPGEGSGTLLWSMPPKVLRALGRE